MNSQEKIYQLALSMLPGIGCVLFKQLINHFGSAQAIFCAKKKALLQLNGIGEQLATEVLKKNTLDKAKKKFDQHLKADIQILSYQEKNYPNRLQQLHDAPSLLYYQGSTNINAKRIVSIVGTRHATVYGKQVVASLMKSLSAYDVLIVSGLAYGIDICAHQSALNYGLSTLAVLASGLDIIYPAAHQKTVRHMLAQGGILSEYSLTTRPEMHQFPARNRIIAGMADATIVVEANKKSGALITAQLAHKYKRAVFAVPGNIHHIYSAGCHELIKKRQAYLLASFQDLLAILQWEHAEKKTNEKRLLQGFTLTPEEMIIVKALAAAHTKTIAIDSLHYQTNIPIRSLAGLLVGLELKGVIQALPGKKYLLQTVD